MRKVERETGAKVDLTKKDDQSIAVPEGYRQLTLQGPLMAIYAAHMLFMRDYNMAEAEWEHKAAQRNGSGNESKRIEDLQKKIEELQAEVRNISDRASSQSVKSYERRFMP